MVGELAVRDCEGLSEPIRTPSIECRATQNDIQMGVQFENDVSQRGDEVRWGMMDGENENVWHGLFEGKMPSVDTTTVLDLRPNDIQFIGRCEKDFSQRDD